MEMFNDAPMETYGQSQQMMGNLMQMASQSGMLNMPAPLLFNPPSNITKEADQPKVHAKYRNPVRTNQLTDEEVKEEESRIIAQNLREDKPYITLDLWKIYELKTICDDRIRYMPEIGIPRTKKGIQINLSEKDFKFIENPFNEIEKKTWELLNKLSKDNFTQIQY